MPDKLSEVDQHQQYLDEHNRLANPCVADRFVFELKRKCLLNETIDSLYEP